MRSYAILGTICLKKFATLSSLTTWGASDGNTWLCNLQILCQENFLLDLGENQWHELSLTWENISNRGKKSKIGIWCHQYILWINKLYSIHSVHIQVCVQLGMSREKISWDAGRKKLKEKHLISRELASIPTSVVSYLYINECSTGAQTSISCTEFEDDFKSCFSSSSNWHDSVTYRK